MQDFDWKILVSLYKTKSITGSAEALFISQPALTKRLRTMEGELGCNIVIRSHSGVEFTQEGELIVKKAKQIVDTINDLHKSILQFQSGASGTISLGVPYSYVRFVLPALLDTFIHRYPDIIVDISTDLSDNLVEKTINGGVEASFARCPVEDELLNKILVSTDQVYAVYNKPFTLDELPDLPYIEYRKNSKTVVESHKWWAATYNTPQKTRLLVPNGDACVSMIKQGLGYGIFFDNSYYNKDDGLFSIPLPAKDGNFFTRNTWLIAPKSRTNPSVDLFLDVADKFFHSKGL